MSTNSQTVDQDQWLTIDQASQLVERSQIAIRAFVQTILEENRDTQLLKPHDSDDRPFSYLIHRSLLEKEFDLAPVIDQVASELPSSSELVSQIDKLQATINDQARRISSLEDRLGDNSFPEASLTSIQKQDQVVVKAVPNLEAKKDWLDEAVEDKENERKKKEEKESKASGSMAFLWVSLAIVTLLALGAGYFVLQKLDKLPF